MSLLWNIVANKTDPNKTPLEQYKACIENIDTNDLLAMLEQDTKYINFKRVILDVLVERGHKFPHLIT